MKVNRKLAALIVALGIAGCGGSGGGGGGGGGSGAPSVPRDVVISWAANHEIGVNSAGGGYRVAITGQSTINVPYVSGSAAPTSTTVKSLNPGTYIVTVTAFATLDAQGNGTGSVSAPSQPITVNVP